MPRHEYACHSISAISISQLLTFKYLSIQESKKERKKKGHEFLTFLYDIVEDIME
jgi:hypothetical protein